MSKYRQSRVCSWKRVVLLTCMMVALIMILRTPMDRDRNFHPRNTEWDRTSVKLFKRQLGLNRLTFAEPPQSCGALWDNETDYLIVTGFLPEKDSEEFESHLWIYFNLLVLEKFDSNSLPVVRLLLPTKTKEILQKVFSDIPFDDLSVISNCKSHVDVDGLLRRARIAGHFDDIAFDESPTARKMQMIILNTDTKRFRELADFDFSFVPYRPHFTKELEQKVRYLVRSAAGLTANSDSRDDTDTDTKRVSVGVETVTQSFVGVHVDAKDNFPELVERITQAMEHKRSAQEEVFFIVACDNVYREDCMNYFDSVDTIIYFLRKEERLALLSSCQGTIISNELSFFGALISNGDAMLVNFDRRKAYEGKSWIRWLADKKGDWTIMTEMDAGAVDE